MRALAARRKTATVAQGTVGLNINQSLDVHASIFAKIAFHGALVLNDLADAVNLVLAQILNLLEWINIRRSQNPKSARVADPENISKADPRLLVAGQIDAGYACHARFPSVAPGSFTSGSGYAATNQLRRQAEPGFIASLSAAN